jgi:hypothetical protein
MPLSLMQSHCVLAADRVIIRAEALSDIFLASIFFFLSCAFRCPIVLYQDINLYTTHCHFPYSTFDAQI